MSTIPSIQVAAAPRAVVATPAPVLFTPLATLEMGLLQESCQGRGPALDGTAAPRAGRAGRGRRTR